MYTRAITEPLTTNVRMKPMEAILTQVDQIIPALQIGFSSSRNHKNDYKQNDRDDNQHQTILHPKKKKKKIRQNMHLSCVNKLLKIS